MKTFNYDLLQQVMKKTGYVMPPEIMDPEAMPPDGQMQQAPVDPEQVAQMAQQALDQGAAPEAVAQALLQQGVPQELVMQIIGPLLQGQQSGSGGPQEGGGSEPQEQQEAPPPLDITALAMEEVKKEKMKQTRTPEDRFLTLEKKVEVLTDIVQGMAETLAKSASDRTVTEGELYALQYMD